MQARKLPVSFAHPCQVVKVIFDSLSASAAFLLADGSIRLASIPALLKSAAPDGNGSSFAFIPSPCSDGCFVSLRRRAAVAEGSSRVPLVHTFFLATMAGLGGGTNLQAWLCEVPLFSQVPARVDSKRDPQMRARLGVSHGCAVQLAASTNFFVVYSPSLAKIWTFSIKVDVNRTSDRTQPLGSARTQTLTLHIVTCAVINCSRPVSFLHLSLQNLLLGQPGGIRIWPLRSLLKQHQTIDTNLNAKICCQKNSTKQPHTGELLKPPEDLHSKTSRSECHCDSKGSNEDDKGGGCNKMDGTILKNGAQQYRREPTNAKHLALSNGYVWKGVPSPTIKKNGLLFLETDGLVDFHSSSSPHQLSQSSSISSTSSATPLCSLPCSVPVSSSTMGSASSLLSFSTSVEPSESFSSGFNKSNNYISLEEDLASFFVAFDSESEQNDSLKTPGFQTNRVIDIQGLSEKEFVVLDSLGRASLLTLQYGGRIAGADKKVFKVARSASLSPLQCCMRISYMAVVPSMEKESTTNEDPEKLKLWISDGAHTVYIVTLPDLNLKDVAVDSNKKEAMPKNLTGMMVMRRSAWIYAACVWQDKFIVKGFNTLEV